MYKPVVLFISIRFMRGSRSTNYFGRLTSFLYILGIAFSTMALITILSVMNGFERELQDNVLQLIPQAIISSSTSRYLNPQQIPRKMLKIHGVNHVTQLTIGDVILQSVHSVVVGIMLGINSVQLDLCNKYVIYTGRDYLKSGRYNVILGKNLARKLKVNCGDHLRIMVPSVNHCTPIGWLPNQRLFNVIGIFSTNTEIDNYQLLINIQDASKLMNYPSGYITGWRLWLSDPTKVDKISKQNWPKGTQWQDWRDHKGELFQAMKIEKYMVKLLLSLIVAVATFNVITFLGLIVKERQKEIAILLTQGLKTQQIMIIFMIQAGISSMIGTLLGSGIGILLATQLNNLMAIIGNLFDGIILPVDIIPIQIIITSLLIVISAIFSALYPSWCASSAQPAKVLKG